MIYTGWIYKWTNKANGKVYIGQTMNKRGYKERWSQHIGNARLNNTNNYFYNAIRKYGEEKFIREVLYEIKSKDKLELKEKLDLLEIELIKKHDSTNRRKGYNSTKGGDFNIWNSFQENDKRYILAKEKVKNKQKKRSSETYDTLRQKVVLVDAGDNLIKKFESLTEASNYLGISLSSAGIICRCGDNKGIKFVNHSGNTQCGNKLRYVEDWVDGLSTQKIRRKYNNFLSGSEQDEYELCSLNNIEVEVGIDGNIIGNSFLYNSDNIKWFYESGYKKLTNKQVKFIKGEYHIPIGGRARIIRTIQKRLGLTNN